MLDNLRIDQFVTVGAEPGEDAGFVIVPQAAIGGDIGRKNSRKPALDRFSAENGLPSRAAGRGGVLLGSYR